MMPDGWFETLKTILVHDEGCRPRPYDDATGNTVHAEKGNISIGIGRNLEANPLSDAAISFLLAEDVTVALQGAASLFGDAFGHYSAPRQHAIVCLIFNLGLSKFMDFQNTIAAIKAGDWQKACANLENSKWHRQVGERSRRILTMLEFEKYPYPGL